MFFLCCFKSMDAETPRYWDSKLLGSWSADFRWAKWYKWLVIVIIVPSSVFHYHVDTETQRYWDSKLLDNWSADFEESKITTK